MFTQVITPIQKPIILDIPEKYLGHPLSITISELNEEESKRYSFENALKFWNAHRVDLSGFTFDREQANER